MIFDVIKTAMNMAELRHVGQCRPNAMREPKIAHIAEVAELVQRSGGSDNEIIASWLHDIIEDTDTELNEIKTVFGDDIANLVNDLSDPDDFAALELSIRKQKQSVRLMSKSKSVKLIKLCDQISNIRSVINDPPLDWSAEKSWAYIVGAKKLADICVNICPERDADFDGLYRQAVVKYKPPALK